MKALIKQDGTLLQGDSEEDLINSKTVEVTEEQLQLLRDGRAVWREEGLVLDDALCLAMRYMKRDYHMEGATPVRNKVHTCSDDRPVEHDIIRGMLACMGLRDGDEFEVCITATGRRPVGDRWFLYRSGRPETDDEVLERIKQGDKVRL